MINIQARTLAEAWKKGFIELYDKGNKMDDPEILKDDMLIAEISEPLSENEADYLHPIFPMKKDVLDAYNDYIVLGVNADKVLPEHALYHSRIFSFPAGDNTFNQINSVIEKLKKDPFSKRAQISMWSPEIDPDERKVPCIQIIWFRVENGKLVMHVHMRACDAYKKFLMNLNICAALMSHVSKSIGVMPGKYVHFVDSFHIYKEDEGQINKAIHDLK
ncbi:MAG: thymidylate synthase [Candidatus Woesearchaeota archaeon]|nr:thymidylate synthase [Candidatus Woesearchaeota archaeon]